MNFFVQCQFDFAIFFLLFSGALRFHIVQKTTNIHNVYNKFMSIFKYVNHNNEFIEVKCIVYRVTNYMTNKNFSF
jgi:hypothetical protein